MPTERKPLHRAHRGRLTHGQDMMLQYGYDERWADAFDSEEEHRDAWIRNRDRLLAWYRHGRRPAAWWQFEAPFRYPGYDRERAVLFEAGLLSEGEARELQDWWRSEFERIFEPSFFHCSGPGHILKDESARKAHIRWMGAPSRLISTVDVRAQASGPERARARGDEPWSNSANCRK